MRYEMSSYFEDPEFKKALNKYEGMVKSHTPAYFDAGDLTDIAEYYASKGRYKEANQAIDFALELHPANTDALIFKARTLSINGKRKEANEIMNSIENEPDREIKFLKADLLIEENRYQEADELFEQLAQSEEQELGTLCDIATVYIDNNQEELAAKWIKRIEQNYNTHDELKGNELFSNVVCDFYCTFNHPSSAIPILQNLLDKHPYSTTAWNNLAKCYLALDNIEEAHEALDFTLAINEDDEEALAMKAFCYRQSGNLEKACDFYIHLSEVGNNKIRAYISLAHIYTGMGSYESAIQCITPLLEETEGVLSPYEKSELYSKMAICHAGIGRIKEGSKYLDEAIRLNKHDADIRTDAGHFYLLADGNVEEAKKQFDQALIDTPDDERSEVLLTIGLTCADMQSHSLAVYYLEWLHDEYPQSEKQVYLPLAYCYFHLNNTFLFMHYLARIKKELPDVYEHLGTDHELFSLDESFNSMVRYMKDITNNGNIDLNQYL